MTEIPMTETELFIKKVLVIWSLEFGYCLEFGIWNLEFKEVMSKIQNIAISLPN